MTHEALNHFFIGWDDEFMAFLSDAIETAPLPIAPLGTAFKSNLQGVNVTVTIPFRLVFTAVMQERFSRLLLAREIRARGEAPTAGETDAERKERFHRDAHDSLNKEMALKEMVDRTVDHTLDNLRLTLSDGDFAGAAKELLRQGTLLAWSALEVLANDLFVSLLNRRPALAVRLAESEDTRRMFQLRNVVFETLSLYNFDLSSRMGDLLIQQHSVDTVPAMKAVFRVIAPSESLQQALSQRALWILNQRRHLTVHRRGVVDQTYLDMTGETLPLGSELQVTPDELEDYLVRARDAGIELIRACGAVLAT